MQHDSYATTANALCVAEALSLPDGGEEREQNISAIPQLHTPHLTRSLMVKS
jgi:hypothetical protein